MDRILFPHGGYCGGRGTTADGAATAADGAAITADSSGTTAEKIDTTVADSTGTAGGTGAIVDDTSTNASLQVLQPIV